MTDDLVELIERDDHARGCEGRWYACSCGYEARIEAGIRQAAARIEALEAENRKLRDGLEHIVSECGRMRNGTDDWFDLADMSMSARTFLAKDSPMQTDAKVAAIARRLTRPQQREIARGSIGDAPMSLVRRLIGMGLMHIKIDSPDGRHGFCVNTDLGERVAQHLKQENSHG